MKITGIDIYPFDIRMHQPFRIATMTTACSRNVLVRIETDSRLVGWGEASPLHSITGETQAVCIAAAHELAPLLEGRNPLEIEALVSTMDALLPHNTTIKSAFDMALYDIASTSAGMPLYRFLGGSIRPMETDLTIGIGDPDQAGDTARQVLAKGFKIVKVKLSGVFQEDDRRLTCIRHAVGPDVKLRIDANQAWDREAAVRSLTAFSKYDIEFCEQPVRAYDIAGMKAVGRAVPIPLMADESLFSDSDALRLVAEDAAPYFNIKLAKSGGIHRALKIAHIAGAGGRLCMVGCMLESRLGLTAAAHFAAACGCVRFYDIDSCFEHAEEPIEGGITFDKGVLTLPDTPGIGARPTAEAIERLEEAAR